MGGLYVVALVALSVVGAFAGLYAATFATMALPDAARRPLLDESFFSSGDLELPWLFLLQVLCAALSAFGAFRLFRGPLRKLSGEA